MPAASPATAGASAPAKPGHAKHAWWDMLHRLREFVARQQRLPRVQAGTNSDGALDLPSERELGLWCREQKQRYGAYKGLSTLEPSQVDALDAIPCWHWYNWQKHWRQRWQQVFEFAQQYGTLPRWQGTQARPLLGGEALLHSWCKNQRSRRAGTHSSNLHRPLTEWEVAKLEGIPFWHWTGGGRAVGAARAGGDDVCGKAWPAASREGQQG